MGYLDQVAAVAAYKHATHAVVIQNLVAVRSKGVRRINLTDIPYA